MAEKKDIHYKHGKYSKDYKNYCLDCGKGISPMAKRCKKCYTTIYQKGKNNPFYKHGLTNKINYCAECGIKISWCHNRCRSCSIKYCYKIGKLNMSRENNPMWKGGITSIYMLIRNSEICKQWRNKIFKRDDYTCQECGSKCGNGKNIILNAHHKKEFSKILSEFLKFHYNLDPIKDKYKLLDLSKEWKEFWQLDNGHTLCVKCHNKTKGVLK